MFKEYTLGKTVVVGYRTYPTVRNLPGRTWVCFDRDSNVQDFLHIPDLVVAGGAKTYAAFLPYVDRVVLSLIPGCHPADVWMPDFESGREILETRDFLTFKRVVYGPLVSTDGNVG
jgi:dihydrofolate reductase